MRTSFLGRHARVATLGLVLLLAPLSTVSYGQNDAGGAGAAGGARGAGTGGNETYRAQVGGGTARGDDDNGEWGWVGLIGLAGLAGLMRRRETHHDRVGTPAHA